MTVLTHCWVCGRELQRFGVERQLGCGIHGSRGANASLAPAQRERLFPDPDFDFTEPADEGRTGTIKLTAHDQPWFARTRQLALA